MFHNESESSFVSIGQLKGSKYKRPGALKGYTGYMRDTKNEEHELNSPVKKIVIRGYTGFRPMTLDIIGEPLIPSEEKQLHPQPKLERKKSSVDEYEFQGHQAFRVYARHMDIMERYADAIQQLYERGQSPEKLLCIVQAKMSERVQSYAAQLIRTKKLFEGCDFNFDGAIDENEFRLCLEKLNVQFDDVQILGLFAYFDDNNDGYVDWQDFADNCMVANPKGGTAVLPKLITSYDKMTKSDLANSKSSLKFKIDLND